MSRHRARETARWQGTERQLSPHAETRARQRGIFAAALALTLQYGRRLLWKGAEFYTIGRRERELVLALGFDPRKVEGISAVCDPGSREVITVYRVTAFDRCRDGRRVLGPGHRGADGDGRACRTRSGAVPRPAAGVVA